MSAPAQLPKSVVYKHGRYYFIAAAGDTRKIKWHPLGKTWSEAYARYLQLVPELKGDDYLKRRIASYQTGDIPDLHIAAMLKQSRANAKARGLEHSISVDDLRELAVNIARQDFPDSVLYRLAAGLSNMAKTQQIE